ncbi:MAG: hypothetical protein AB7U30_01640, partial [Sulfuricellaceae bacterium]
MARVKPEGVSPISGVHVERDAEFAVVCATGVVIGSLICVEAGIWKKGLELPLFFFVLEIVVHELSMVRINTGETAFRSLSRIARAVGGASGMASLRVGKVLGDASSLHGPPSWPKSEVELCLP